MVFQDFALWPHMTVAQNVAFPPRARRCSGVEIAGRTEKALAPLGLDGLAARRPHASARPILATFILREFDQGSPATGMAMGVIAISVSILSISVARRLVPKKA